MAYSEHLADRIRQALDDKHISYEEKKMMGGLTFMVDGKMCVGTVNDDLMARVDPDIFEEALKLNGSREMDFTGRPMKGFLFISPEGTESSEDLEYWIDLCLAYNPKAPSRKKK